MMGEMADYDLDLGFDGPFSWSPLPTPPRCMYCGKRNLFWRQIPGHGWRLHEGAAAHECEPYRRAHAQLEKSR